MTSDHDSGDENWQFATVRGARLAWLEHGAGHPVVWAHALSTSSFGQEDAGMFDWAPVARSGRMIRYDARGHGRSTGSPVPDEFTFPGLAADLLALLDQVAPSEPVHGLGSSLGTATLLHAAVRTPERFDRLVLTSAPTAWESRAPQAELYRTSADLVERDGTGAFEAMVAQAASPEIFRDLPGYPLPLAIGGTLLPSVLRGVALSDLPDRDDIARLRLPVLLLAWATDPGHPVSTAERLAELIPGAELRVADTVEQCRTWGELAADFLG